MRRVRFKIYGPAPLGKCRPHDYLEVEGYFHQWALGSLETRDALINYTIAICETDDGQVHAVNPDDIQFLTSYSEILKKQA